MEFDCFSINCGYQKQNLILQRLKHVGVSGKREMREDKDMAKKIKVPLKMKNGALVRTLEELREHFDMECLIEHYESGKLLTWLEERYYDVEAEKISALDSTNKNFHMLLCDALGIKGQDEVLLEADMDFLKRRVEKRNYLKKLTTDENILNHVDDIAITQEDLIELLDMKKQVIYLCEGVFTVPLSVTHMTYIGLFHPCAVVRATDNVNFKEKQIIFQNMPFLWDISNVSMSDRVCQAERLFMEGDYVQAAALCEAAAEQEGNPRALALLYRIYLEYLCDTEKAEAYRNKGAALNFAYSMLDKDCCAFMEWHQEQIKRMAETGTSLDKFYYAFALYQWSVWQHQKAHIDMLLFYQKAAGEGNPTALFDLGNRYYYGNGVNQDYVQAKEWYLKASAKGHAQAKKKIGDFYYYGIGESQDYQKAMEWYEKASTLGENDALEMLAVGYSNGDGVRQDYQRAFALREKAAKKGNRTAMANLGWHYRWGYGVAQDYTQAKIWFLKGANLGSSFAQKNLGDFYSYGYGVEKDTKKAEEWYQKSKGNGKKTENSNIPDQEFVENLAKSIKNFAEELKSSSLFG